jgi:hypothetical protein
VLLNIKLAFIAFANRFALMVSFIRERKGTYLIRDLFLFVNRKVDECIVLCADQKWNGRLVKATPLSVPLLDAVERALAREVKHEKNSDCIIAYERQHVDEFALTAEIPDGKGDFGIANGYRLFHKVHTYTISMNQSQKSST